MFLDIDDTVVKDSDSMLEITAIHCEQLFSESIVYRSQPYVDSSVIIWEKREEPIPLVNASEVRKAITKVKRKRSTDAYGILSHMIAFIPDGYIALLVRIYKETLKGYSGPSLWKHSRMKLISKEDSVCKVKDTRPISLLDIFLKLFLRRFQSVLNTRGILHDSQSGFRSNLTLKSRVLNLID
jgi:hypothetical protein